MTLSNPEMSGESQHAVTPLPKVNDDAQSQVRWPLIAALASRGLAWQEWSARTHSSRGHRRGVVLSNGEKRNCRPDAAHSARESRTAILVAAKASQEHSQVAREMRAELPKGLARADHSPNLEMPSRSGFRQRLLWRRRHHPDFLLIVRSLDFRDFRVQIEFAYGDRDQEGQPIPELDHAAVDALGPEGD